MHTVTPHLVCAGAAEAIEFYQTAFGATELSRVPGANGKLMHASVRIGDSVVMLNEEMPNGAPRPEISQGLGGDDPPLCREHERRLRAGGRRGREITMPLDDMFWGDRYGKVEDPFGHQWSSAPMCGM